MAGSVVHCADHRVIGLPGDRFRSEPEYALTGAAAVLGSEQDSAILAVWSLALRPVSPCGFRPVLPLMAVWAWWRWARARTTLIWAVQNLEMIWALHPQISTRTSWVAPRRLLLRLLLQFLRSDRDFVVVSGP